MFISLLCFYKSCVKKEPLHVKCSYCYFVSTMCSFFESKINCTVTTGEPCFFLIETTNLISVSHQNSRPPKVHQNPLSHDSLNKCWLGEMKFTTFIDCQSSLANYTNCCHVEVSKIVVC